MWDVSHQPLLIVILSHHLKFGEHTCWVVQDTLIYACCSGTVVNRISMHIQKYHPIQDAGPHSPSLILDPLGFVFYPYPY